MPNVFELMTTENIIEIRNLSMFIMKSLKIRQKNFILIKYAPLAFLYIPVVDLLMCNCIYIECIHVCLLLVYRDI